VTGKPRKWSFRYHVASPIQDPYLLIEFLNESCAVLFDCGVRVWGRVKVILKLKHLFITHAHIDHMIGFDHIIRSLLGENTTLNIYGPPGIKDRIASKLMGYDWDRAADQQLILKVHELGNKMRILRVHECRERFNITSEDSSAVWDGVAIETPSFTVNAVTVDHGGSPCLAYSFVEPDRCRINKEKMFAIGLKPGPWVGKFLSSLEKGDTPQSVISNGEHDINCEELKRDIVEVQKGQKIVYVTEEAEKSGLQRRYTHLGINVSGGGSGSGSEVSSFDSSSSCGDRQSFPG
jgi:ribonuclease Z